MINNDQKPKEKYHEYVDFKGQELEVRGEVFPEPIRKNEEAQLKTRVSILTDDGILWGTGEIFYKEATKNELIELVRMVKLHIDKYKPIPKKKP